MMKRIPRVHSLNLWCQARFAEEGWTVKVHGDDQTYYLQRGVSVVLPDRGINEGKTYEVTLEERNEGWVGIGYNGRASYIRTIRPEEHIHVELLLEDAAKLVEKMQAQEVIDSE